MLYKHQHNLRNHYLANIINNIEIKGPGSYYYLL